jgi:hypothetical protein
MTPPRPGPDEETGPPDFVGIGVQKAGTTWWYELLATHPGVSTPNSVHKERHFFDRYATLPFGPPDVVRYEGWFPRRRGTLAGEWTPDYFTYPWVPRLLHLAAPQVMLLLLLRDPIERLRSGLAHQERRGARRDGTTVADAIDRGFYHRALDRWLEWFDPGQLLVLQYEQCVSDPDGQLASTFDFLGLTEYHVAETERPARPPVGVTTPLDPDVKARLVALYDADVRALAEQVPHLDLSCWPNFAYLTGPPSAPAATGLSSPTDRR